MLDTIESVVLSNVLSYLDCKIFVILFATSKLIRHNVSHCCRKVEWKDCNNQYSLQDYLEYSVLSKLVNLKSLTMIPSYPSDIDLFRPSPRKLSMKYSYRITNERFNHAPIFSSLHTLAICSSDAFSILGIRISQLCPMLETLSLSIPEYVNFLDAPHSREWNRTLKRYLPAELKSLTLSFSTDQIGHSSESFVQFKTLAHLPKGLSHLDLSHVISQGYSKKNHFALPDTLLSLSVRSGCRKVIRSFLQASDFDNFDDDDIQDEFIWPQHITSLSIDGAFRPNSVISFDRLKQLPISTLVLRGRGGAMYRPEEIPPSVKIFQTNFAVYSEEVSSGDESYMSDQTENSAHSDTTTSSPISFSDDDGVVQISMVDHVNNRNAKIEFVAGYEDRFRVVEFGISVVHFLNSIYFPSVSNDPSIIVPLIPTSIISMNKNLHIHREHFRFLRLVRSVCVPRFNDDSLVDSDNAKYHPSVVQNAFKIWTILRSVKHVHLNTHKIMPSSIIKLCPNLTSLEIGRHGISKFANVSSIAFPPTLTEFSYLGAQSIIQSFESFTNLTSLDMDVCQLVGMDQDWSFLSSLSSMKSMHVYNDNNQDAPYSVHASIGIWLPSTLEQFHCSVNYRDHSLLLPSGREHSNELKLMSNIRQHPSIRTLILYNICLLDAKLLTRLPIHSAVIEISAANISQTLNSELHRIAEALPSSIVELSAMKKPRVTVIQRRSSISRVDDQSLPVSLDLLKIACESLPRNFQHAQVGTLSIKRCFTCSIDQQKYLHAKGISVCRDARNIATQSNYVAELCILAEFVSRNGLWTGMITEKMKSESRLYTTFDI